MSVEGWWAQERRQGVTAEVSSGLKRNVMSWTRANSSSSRSTTGSGPGAVGGRENQLLVCYRPEADMSGV